MPLVSDVDSSLLDVASPLTRVLVIAGAESDPVAARASGELIEKMRAKGGDWRSRFPVTAISWIATPYPDGKAAAEFPPKGRAYDDPVNAEAIYLWRWVGMLAPDVVVVVRAGKSAVWGIPKSAQPDQVQRGESAFVNGLVPRREVDDVRGLVRALTDHAVCDVATIPAVELSATEAEDLEPLLQALQERPVRSPARDELLRRRSRSPVEVAQELGRVYGQRLDEVTYIPAVALVARLRLGELTGDRSQRSEVEALLKPYLAGEKPALPEKSTGSQQAGHLVFGELAGVTGDGRYLELLRRAADLGFGADGRMLDAMPAHAEMSDAVFLGTPLLAQMARFSGEAKYREMALRHLRFMVKLNQRPDGLHRHSPVAPDQTAWGRGNGFVTMGLALTLSELPEESAEFQEVLTMYRDHLHAMKPLQDELGMWHQVVDHPESYREFTVTCMTTFAITRGLRRGWLDSEIYEPVVRSAWRSIQQRTAADGGMVDVCAGTGKMKSLREYLDRPAILGRDDRGGAMVFLLCTELALAEREEAISLK